MPTISQGSPSERSDAEQTASDVVEPLWKKVLNDRFTILEPIGSGGMGKVYKAIQSPLDRVVAVKVLKSTPHLDPGFRQRFFLEASHTSKLRHPNTVTVIDYGETSDGIFYLAMEYLDGHPLAQILAESGPLHWARCLHIAQQVCRSLREAHRLGIVHRDLKPSNVMLLTEDGDQDLVKVLDFGLVKSFVRDAGAQEAEITNPGIFLGSPQYMAPEQLRGEADPRSDIYSLGVMLYQMLVGKPPFVADDAIDVMFQHMNDAPLPLRSVRPDLSISEEIEKLVMRCLEKKPVQRPQSMDEVLEAIRRVGFAGGQAAQAVSSGDTGSYRRPERVEPPPLPPAAEQTLAIDIDVLAPPIEIPPALPQAAPWSSWAAENFPVLVAAFVALVLVIGGGVVIVRPRQPVRNPTVSTSANVFGPGPAGVIPKPAQSRPIPQPIVFRIVSTPPGARLFVNGKATGQTPLAVQLTPGADGKASAEISFKLDGFQPLTVITAGAGPEVLVNERLEPIVSPRISAARRQREVGIDAAHERPARERAPTESEPKVIQGEFLGDTPAPRQELAAPPPPGAGSGGPGPSRIELDDSKVRLTKISGPDPQYTAHALEGEIEGVMVVKCGVTGRGAVQNCRVLRGLPFMDRAVVMALEARKYRPYLVNGQPVDIDYTFNIRLALPR
jgi:serine/threonine-protein kinase